MSERKDIPDQVGKLLPLADYSDIKVRLCYQTEEGNPVFDVDLTPRASFELNIPFNPFSTDEVALLVSGNAVFLTKRLRFNGVVGNLVINYMFRYSHQDEINWLCDTASSPWRKNELRPQDIDKFPVSLSFCFNGTNKITPKFDLHFPEAARDHFLGLVTDWDLNEERGIWDATHFIYKPDNLQEPVLLRLPLDASRLSALEITALDDFVRYPQKFGPELE